jgi:Flp pilus assembly protein TadB
VTGIRIIAVLAAIAVMAILEYGLATPWYIALPVGILTYLLARYVGWAIGERRRFKRELDETVEKVKRRPF